MVKTYCGNNPLLPRSIRSVIVGKSGCGKTTLETNKKKKNLLIFGDLILRLRPLAKRPTCSKSILRLCKSKIKSRIIILVEDTSRRLYLPQSKLF